MALSAGTRLGSYEILGAIGAGGMGEVYRARDGKLNRDVALKVLPDSFANDPERLARFQREAHVLASLNHPNIAHIHGIEDAPSTDAGQAAVRALVMELVEGPTLADRIAQGAIPLAEALPIAKQIADALEAAHAQGIIHRDLKPANIKVRDDGTVKVLDFGLAKAVVSDGASGTANAMNSPTITSPAMMTGAGIILGTAAYMSPEQAKGKAVDKRTDIWAFGCVLFEMLTGRRAFDGDDVTDTLAFIITKEPEWAALPANTPASIRQLLRRCVQKDRGRRLADIADARFEIEEGLIAPVTQAPVTIPAFRGKLPWVFATTVLAVAVLLLGFAYIRQAPLQPPTTRFQVPLPEKTTTPMFRVSPDGRMLAISAAEGARTRLWIRPLDSLDATPLAGTDDATYPFWSPDSAHIGFFAQGKLKKIAVAGGPPQTLCNAGAGRGGTWNADGVIVFSDLGSGLSRVPAAGGVSTALTTKPATTSEVHRFPEFLPGGARFIFTISGALSDANGIFAGSLDGSPPVRILSDGSNAVYVPSGASVASGHLLFRREGTLVAQPFDPERLALIGETFPVAEQVGTSVHTQNGAFWASRNGVLVYGEGSVETQMRELVWIDRTGRRVGSLGPPGRLIAAALSPDEKTISFSMARAAGDTSDVWLHDVRRNLRSRLTFRPGFVNNGVWSPDGSRIVFGSANSTVYQKPANGTGNEELLLRFGINLRLLDWSADGRFVVFQAQAGDEGTSLFLLPIEGDRKPIPYLQTPFNEAEAQFSPNGRWMAYASNESGEPQVYVQAIPASGRKWQISTAGGSQPRWRQDGEELFYLSGDQKLMAVSVKTGAAFETGSPQPLFDIPPVYPALFGLFAYQPTRLGDRFLVTLPAAGAATPLTVVLNWQAGLKK